MRPKEVSLLISWHCSGSSAPNPEPSSRAPRSSARLLAAWRPTPPFNEDAWNRESGVPSESCFSAAVNLAELSFSAWLRRQPCLAEAPATTPSQEQWDDSHSLPFPNASGHPAPWPWSCHLGSKPGNAARHSTKFQSSPTVSSMSRKSHRSYRKPPCNQWPKHKGSLSHKCK